MAVKTLCPSVPILQWTNSQKTSFSHCEKMLWQQNARAEALYASQRPGGSKQHIKKRQKNVVPTVRNVVLPHVTRACEAQNGRQPAVQNEFAGGSLQR
jgi:hypothetical protein